MKIWGITGVIGSGKSTAIRYLAEKGYSVIDADEISRIVVDRNRPEGKEGFEAIFRAFGGGVLDNLGNLDRLALRKRMMLNPADRDTLESILHPRIIDYIRKITTRWREEGKALGFIEGARIVESGLDKVLAGVIIVSASNEIRMKRVMKRDGMGKDEVLMMFGLQDEAVMKAGSKTIWMNEKKEKDLYGIIDLFLANQKAKK